MWAKCGLNVGCMWDVSGLDVEAEVETDVEAGCLSAGQSYIIYVATPGSVLSEGIHLCF